MKISKISYRTSMFCPNTGKQMMFNDFDSFSCINDISDVYVEHCPYCGEEHLFNFLDKNQQCNIEIVDNQVVVETITTNE